MPTSDFDIDLLVCSSRKTQKSKGTVDFLEAVVVGRFLTLERAESPLSPTVFWLWTLPGGQGAGAGGLLENPQWKA